jgi:MFS family permease
MLFSGGNIRLVFWIAVIPAFLSVALLAIAVDEPRCAPPQSERKPSLHRLHELPSVFWWLVAIAAVLELARFSQAFLLLKARDVGVDNAFVPMLLMLMSAAYGLSAYPCGILADHVNRKRQLTIGAATLLVSHVVLAHADTAAVTAAGAALWGLQMGIIQGLIAASIADAAPMHLRGTAFGLYYLVDGIVSLLSSSGAGVVWAVAGATATFTVGAGLSTAVLLLLLASPRRFTAQLGPV